MVKSEARSEAFNRGRDDCRFNGITADEILSARYYANTYGGLAKAYWLGVLWESRYINPLPLRRFASA